jgi:hypothetical protein
MLHSADGIAPRVQQEPIMCARYMDPGSPINWALEIVLCLMISSGQQAGSWAERYPSSFRVQLAAECTIWQCGQLQCPSGSPKLGSGVASVQVAGFAHGPSRSVFGEGAKARQLHRNC